MRRKCTDGYMKERGTEIQREGGRQVNPACLAGALHTAFYSSLAWLSFIHNVFVMSNKSNGWSSPSAVAFLHQFLHPSSRFCDLIPTTDPPGLEARAQAFLAAWEHLPTIRNPLWSVSLTKSLSVVLWQESRWNSGMI